MSASNENGVAHVLLMLWPFPLPSRKIPDLGFAKIGNLP